MTDDFPRPIAGLRFERMNGDIASSASEGFWALWRHDADALRALGLRPSKRNEGSRNAYWVVTWAPGKVAADVVDSKIADLQLKLFAAQRDTSDHQRVVEQRERDEEAQRRQERELRLDLALRKLIERYGNLTDEELTAAAQREAMACRQQWGAFCVSKKRMYAFTSADARISPAQAVWLIDLVDQTNAKAESVRDNLIAAKDPVDWTDDEVVDAVQRLTWDDHDRASAENGLGWSKADSSKGHWCAGMMKLGGADRMIGIDAARAIVGKYARQLGRGQEAA